ncbi:MAG: hypothetical protein FIB01_03605, partial [Gemmatimonadetes bacterium]|nr:hypothetical protein [Gemmatimonadota bacterium]
MVSCPVPKHPLSRSAMTRSILLRRLLLLLSLWVGTPLPLAAQGTAFPELLPRRLADVGLLLDRTSGLRLQPIAGGLGGAAIRIRGLSGRYTQLLLDGLPLLGASASPLSALQLPPIGLTGVEVQAGPASARYGLHAAGGLVDLVSRRPDGQREAWYHETSREGTDVLVYWSGAARPLSYTVTGGLHAQDMLDPDDDVWADVPAFRRVTVRPRAFWQGARGTLVATAGGTWEKREGGTPAGRRLKNNVQYREQLETRRADAGLNGRYRLGESLHLGVRAAAVRDRRERRLNTTITADARAIALLEATLLGRGGAHRW